MGENGSFGSELYSILVFVVRCSLFVVRHRLLMVVVVLLLLLFIIIILLFLFIRRCC